MTDTQAHWWQTGIIYQIYPRSFQDSNGDGIGDLRGIMSRLDYLAWLGVDAIWISPVYKSPMADFGYDVADYRTIDPMFGTLEDFDELLAKAHEHGLKVVLDFVPNHTSDQHAWFVEARAGKDNPKRDWYIWRDPKADGTPPNNWLSYFGGPAWTLDEASGQYYLHNFLPEQPDLNYRNPAVKEAVFEDLRFWLERGVDGFRVDVIDRMLKHPDLLDNPTNANYVTGRDNPVGALLRKHSEAGEGIHELIQEFQAVLKSYGDRVSIGEIAYYDNPSDMASFYGAHASQEIDLPFNFGLIMLPWNANVIRSHVDAYDSSIPAHGWPNYVMSNHDQHRTASRVGGEAQARAAAVLLLTLRGTPTLYYGEELGMANVLIPQHLVQDPQGKNIPGYTRDVARTPMQWDASPHAGFSTVEPWLPLAENYQTVNVAVQEEDPHSVLSLYHRLIAYRRRTPALTMGSYYLADYPPEDCFIYLREHEGQRCLIAINFAAEARTLVLAGINDAETGSLIISSQMDRAGDVDLRGLELRPYEAIVLEV